MALQPDPFSSDFSSPFGSGQPVTTWNIHYNLSAWASGTVTVAGNRISTGGSAYQCLKGGTTSIGNAPTGQAAFIATNDGLVWKWLSLIDYTSLQAWATAVYNAYNVSGQPANWLVLLWNNGPITTTIGNAYLNQSGIAAGSFSTLITCAPGESYRDKGNGIPAAFNAANGVAFDTPATGAETGQYFYVVINNWTFSGIQFRDLNPAASAAMINLSGNVGQCVDCLFDGYTHVYTNGASVGVVNCVFINRCTTPLISAWPVKWDTACTGGYVAGCTASCIGGSGGPGSVFVWLPTIAGGATMVNTAIFGCTNAIKSQNVADGWHCNSCISDVTSFASDAVATSCIFSATASNEYVNSSTDLRLKSSAQSVDAGVTDTTYNTTADDIFRTTRPQGAAWDIGAYEYGLFNVNANAATAASLRVNRMSGKGYKAGSAQVASSVQTKSTGSATYTKALGVVTAGVALAIKQVGKLIAPGGYGSGWSTGWSTGFTGTAGLVQSAAVATTKTIGAITHSLSLSAVAASAWGFARTRIGGSSSSAINAQTTALGALIVFRKNVSATTTPQLISIRRFMGKSIGLVSTQSFGVSRFLNKTPLGTVSSQASSLTKTKLAGFVGSISSVQLFAITKSTAKIISAIHTAAFSYVQRTTKTSLATTTSQTAAEVTTGHLISHTTSPAASPEVAAAQTQRPLNRSFAATTSQALASFQGKLHITILAASSGYAALVQRQTAALRGTTNAQIATIQKLVSRIFGGASAQAASVAKAAGRILGGASAAVQTLVRTPGKVFGTAMSQGALIVRAISKATGVASVQVAASMTGARTLQRVFGVAGTSAAGLVRQIAKAFGAASGASQASAKSVGVPLAVGHANVAALLGLLGRTHPLVVAAASGEAVTVLKTPGKLLLAVDAQVAALLRNRVHTVLVVSPQTAGAQRQISIIRPAASPNIAAWARGGGRILGAVTQNIARLFVSRVKSLGTPQSSSQTVVAWYRFYIPPAYGPAVLVPPADGPPEPFSFGPMDPADTSISIFDWSKRMTSGDTIFSAVVTSIPPGMNFVGPVTIQGPFVEIICGPFSPPQVPTVYGLRCSVVFVSGRRSTFTVPVPVRVL